MVTANSYTVKREKYWGEVRYVTKYLMGSRIVFVMVFIKKLEGDDLQSNFLLLNWFLDF